MNAISAVIIVHNEEKTIADCLANVKTVADEIVVVDSMSTDRTAEICRGYTDRVYQQPFKGFGPQKQDAVAHATNAWILQIDADERLSPGLIDEIRAWKTTDPGQYAGYALPFKLYFMGKLLRFGGCGGETHVRLFRKDRIGYGNKNIHEAAIVSGTTGALKNHIRHYSYEDLQEYFEKFNRYTSLIAREKFDQGKRFHAWHLLRMPYEFMVRYILKLGFLDGLPGFIYAGISSFYAFTKYIKLWELERKQKRIN